MAIFGCCFGSEYVPPQRTYPRLGRVFADAGETVPALRRISELPSDASRPEFPPLDRLEYLGEAPAPTPLSYRKISEQYPEVPRPKLPPLTRRLERPAAASTSTLVSYRWISERAPIESAIHDAQIKVTDADNLLTKAQKKLLLERMQEVHTFFYEKFGIEAVSPIELFPPMQGRKDDPDNARWSSDFKKDWYFGSRSLSLETVAHEYIHAVVQQMTNLGDDDEENALDESLADVFASIFKQYKAGQSVEKADWQMTDEGEMYRSLKDFPKEIKYPQLTGEEHDDAAIPNYAFYHAATKIGGNSWETVGKIWCEAMKNTKGRRNALSFPAFVSFSQATIVATEKLFPKKQFPKHEQIVSEAWAKVGVDPKPKLVLP